MEELTSGPHGVKAVKSRLAAAAERADLLESEVASRAAGCGAAERRSAACAKKEVGAGASGRMRRPQGLVPVRSGPECGVKAP